MLLTLAWSALGIAAFPAAALVLDRRNRAAHLATLRAAWGCALDRDRDMAAIFRLQASARRRHNPQCHRTTRTARRSPVAR